AVARPKAPGPSWLPPHALVCDTRVRADKECGHRADWPERLLSTTFQHHLDLPALSSRSRQNKRPREKEAGPLPHLNFGFRFRRCAPRGPLFANNTTHLDDLQLHEEQPQTPA